MWNFRGPGGFVVAGGFVVPGDFGFVTGGGGFDVTGGGCTVVDVFIIGVTGGDGGWEGVVAVVVGGSGADGTRGRAYDSRVFCDLRGSKTTFLPGMGGRGGELRDAGWAKSLGVDNLILVT